MNNNYYIVQQGKQRGPLKFEDLMQVQYGTGTQLWTPGLQDWIAVSSMEDVVVKVSAANQGQGIPGSGTGFTSTGTTSAFLKTEMQRSTAPGISVYEPASLGLRFAGMFLMGLLTMVLFSFTDRKSTLATITVFIVPLSSLVTYHFWSGNLGHFLLGMKVVQAPDGNDFNKPLLGFIREFIKGLLLSFIIPVIWLLWDKQRQNLYDKIFNTRVVMRAKKQ